ncbi:universal stress protein [Conexibacter stalactiti]|uniref:Universal stress protein n=1 Tax=Conexibacter stalactiti TaxID=1940611 RepID=A0ABU4HU57_9ACTN|nr:universal stress protein [Conexibacter stalactiti]MDW5596788.1 universal stress protein [Conexibacter stalactiti]MEC5037430.1 universal stress protein [Conexibacter stalactiti]
MGRILIGFDGSSHGEDALALGRALAAAEGGDTELVVAIVYKAVIQKDSHGTESDYQGRLRYEAEQELERARAQAPELPAEAFRAVRASSAASGLHRLAEELEAEAIVVGTSHRGALGRVWAGSATEQVLHGAPVPVAVAPVDYAKREESERTLRRVGVAYDGSPESKHALGRAIALAQAAGAQVVPISVVDLRTPTTIAYGYEKYVDAVRELVALELREAGETVAGAADVDLVEREGEPARELAEASKTVDLLVAGSRGYGPLKRVLLGSVSSRLVREAEGPLLLLPRSAVEAE